jgi:hypothetical protein
MHQRGTIPTRISTFDTMWRIHGAFINICGDNLVLASDSSEVMLCKSWQSLASDESAEIQQSKVDIIL